MNNVESTANDRQALVIYLLTIRGTLAPPTLEASRDIHNETAGAPANIAAAQSLGDLSHMVYVPAAGSGTGAGEFMIMDVWNSLEGLNSFFANPHVQEQGGLIFTTRDPVVWAPAQGFSGYHLQAPYGENDRIIAIVRGGVNSRADAQAIHNGIVHDQVSKARKAGAMSHDAYFRLAPPDSPEALEFLAVDVWTNAASMAEYYQNPDFARGFKELFSTPPDTSTWTHPVGAWAEW